MSGKIKIYSLLAISIILFGCARKYDNVYEPDYFDEVEYNALVNGDCPDCQKKGTIEEQYTLMNENYERSVVNAAGVRICPPHKRCTGDRLPPRPCAQPMPKYYGNASPKDFADGVVLIHPFTRTKVICYDDPSMSASECAQMFHNRGYVYITDIPQLPAKYDFLKKGTYPTRRWRGGGEVVPRW